MSFRATTLKRSFLSTLFLGLLCVPAFPQAKDSPLVFNNYDGVTTSFVNSPSFSNNAGASSDNQWLKVEFHYSVTLKPGQGNYLPEATFKVWIEGRDMLDPQGKPDTGIAVGLTGSVTYINIEQNKDCYGVVYVHPSTLGRYSQEGPSDFDRKFNVHVQASVGYAIADYFDKRKETDPNWYLQLKPIDGLVYRQDQTGFILTDPDKYPAMPPLGSDASSTAAAPTAPSPAPAPPSTPPQPPTPAQPE